MIHTLPAKEVTLRDLIDNFGIQLVEDESFFQEWQETLPLLSQIEREQLDKVKAGYLNLLNHLPLLENAVRMAVVDPLLFIGDFYLFPFRIKAEKSVEISTEDEGILIKGKIDTLILKDQLWVMIIESKRIAYSVEAGLAQLLAYLMSNPSKNYASYGLITNGGEFMFVKLLWQNKPLYGTSHVFSMRNSGDLYEVLKILKHLCQLIIN